MIFLILFWVIGFALAYKLLGYMPQNEIRNVLLIMFFSFVLLWSLPINVATNGWNFLNIVAAIVVPLGLILEVGKFVLWLSE